MPVASRRPCAARRRRDLALLAAAFALAAQTATAQELSGTLIGTVKDVHGIALAGARARIGSPALIDGSRTTTSDDKGRIHFRALPPGVYVLDVELNGFASSREEGIRIGAGTTISRTVPLSIPGLAATVVVIGSGSRIDAREPGFGTRFLHEDIRAIPTRRSSMLDLARTAPGVSPTSLSSGVVHTMSVFGSATNENLFLLDGGNTTCPCNGAARAEVGVDFIGEVRILSAGASAEFGNMQGAAINVITRSGTNRLLYDAAYYGQTSHLTSRPVELKLATPATGTSGYSRIKYRDLTTTLGGPIVRDRVWLFAGYQYLRDYDSQPGLDATFPRTYEQNKFFTKLTWRLATNWHLVQSLHYEYWVNPERPTIVTPPEATVMSHASVPAVTFGHLTRAWTRTVWEVRAGRFVWAREDEPRTGNWSTPGTFDTLTGVSSGAPRAFGSLTLSRTSATTTVSRYRPAFLGADHELKVGGHVERGEHNNASVIPSGVRFVTRNGLPFQAVSSAPANVGGRFVTAGAFVSDGITLRDRLTINAGLRFDYNQAISQDLPAVDLEGHETGEIIPGLGPMYSWQIWSPRIGLTARLTADGRTMLRASYGRYSQGILTGELAFFHPGSPAIVTTAFNPVTGLYTTPVSVVDVKTNLDFDRNMRPPRTDEYSVGVDREIGGRLVTTLAYVHKAGADFIGWTDVGGVYAEESRVIDGQTVPVFVLKNGTNDRRFLLTNPSGYSMAYDGLVIAVERRRANGWQIFASYTWSRTVGLQVSSGATAVSPHVSTVAPPAGAAVTFGRDPNDLTNAYGRLPNDRPHMFRIMGSVDVPRTGLMVAANLQYASGKPWAATAQILLPQGNQRVLLEPPGSRRLSSQTLLDLRVSRPIHVGETGRIELILDVLNLLNSTSEEAIATDNLSSQTFAQPTVFVDPRRVMLGVRFSFGR